MRLIKIVAVGLFVWFTIGCFRNEQRGTIFSGTIHNATDSLLIINKFLSEDPIDSIAIDDNGKFKDILNLTEGNYFVRNGLKGRWFYFSKGNEVSIQADMNKLFSSIECVKDETGINQYLIEKHRSKQKLLNKHKLNYVKPAQEFKVALMKVKREEDSVLLSKEYLPKAYKKQEKKNIHYESLDKLITYAKYANFNKQEITPDFFSELDSENLDSIDSKDYFFSEAYRNLIRWNVEKRAKEMAEKDNMDIPLATIKVIGKIQDQEIKNNLAYIKTIKEGGMNLTKNPDEYMTVFKEASNNNQDIEAVTVLCERIKKIQKGNPSPKFVDYENYEGGITSLDDLKGKYVYIDMWATWCLPCIKEAPYLKKLIKEYKHKNIVFVSISLDERKNYDKWRAMVAKEETVLGIHLFADNAFNSQFSQEYFVMSIPRFVLLDPGGKIIDNDAPEPSSEELITLFKEYNI